jgi:hypothetical protein
MSARTFPVSPEIVEKQRERYENRINAVFQDIGVESCSAEQLIELLNAILDGATFIEPDNQWDQSLLIWLATQRYKFHKL